MVVFIGIGLLRRVRRMGTCAGEPLGPESLDASDTTRGDVNEVSPVYRAALIKPGA